MNWIETYTGKRFDFNDIESNEIDIKDIAHSLSLQTRFAGHCKFHYSVAQHSVYVLECVKELTNDKNTWLASLLHDASEAYLVDVPRPIKPLLKGYTELEYLVQSKILEKFNIEYKPKMKEIIKLSDDFMLRTEARELMVSQGENWTFGFEEIWLNPYLEEIYISQWEPKKAESVFLKKFNELVIL